MKLCKDCRWHELNTDMFDKDAQMKFSICENPKNMIYYTDLVTGTDKVRRDLECCRDQRDINWLGSVIIRVCGRSARWFELPIGENNERSN